jgi:hypothetical protein
MTHSLEPGTRGFGERTRLACQLRRLAAMVHLSPATKYPLHALRPSARRRREHARARVLPRICEMPSFHDD